MRTVITALLVVALALVAFGEKLEITANETALNMRDKPSPKGKIVGMILKGQQYEIVGKAASYYRVRATDKVSGEEVKGWVWVNQVGEVKNAALYYIKKPGVAVRAKPDCKAKIVGALHSGSRVHEILEKYIIWYEVKSGALRGWVSASYCGIVKGEK